MDIKSNVPLSLQHFLTNLALPVLYTPATMQVIILLLGVNIAVKGVMCEGTSAVTSMQIGYRGKSGLYAYPEVFENVTSFSIISYIQWGYYEQETGCKIYFEWNDDNGTKLIAIKVAKAEVCFVAHEPRQECRTKFLNGQAADAHWYHFGITVNPSRGRVEIFWNGRKQADCENLDLAGLSRVGSHKGQWSLSQKVCYREALNLYPEAYTADTHIYNRVITSEFIMKAICDGVKECGNRFGCDRDKFTVYPGTALTVRDDGPISNPHPTFCTNYRNSSACLSNYDCPGYEQCFDGMCSCTGVCAGGPWIRPYAPGLSEGTFCASVNGANTENYHHMCTLKQEICSNNYSVWIPSQRSCKVCTQNGQCFSYEKCERERCTCNPDCPENKCASLELQFSGVAAVSVKPQCIIDMKAFTLIALIKWSLLLIRLSCTFFFGWIENNYHEAIYIRVGTTSIHVFMDAWESAPVQLCKINYKGDRSHEGYWYHIAVTVDTVLRKIQIYRDGKKQGQCENLDLYAVNRLNPYNRQGRWQMSQRSCPLGAPVDLEGYMSDIHIYDHVLTEGFIKAAVCGHIEECGNVVGCDKDKFKAWYFDNGTVTERERPINKAQIACH